MKPISRVTGRDLISVAVIWLVCVAAMLFGVFPNWPIRVSGWIAVFVAAPVFFLMVSRHIPAGNMTARQTIAAITLILLTLFIFLLNDRCGNCVGQYY